MKKAIGLFKILPLLVYSAVLGLSLLSFVTSQNGIAGVFRKLFTATSTRAIDATTRIEAHGDGEEKKLLHNYIKTV